eukprot:8589639-Alexandrium_andersonii.AAC.1
MFSHPRADMVVTLAQQALQVIHNTYRKFGLQLNYGPEKTACMLSFVGVGSAAMRQQFYGSGSCRSMFDTRDGPIEAPVVH